jgi:hypothetical protein
MRWTEARRGVRMIKFLDILGLTRRRSSANWRRPPIRESPYGSNRDRRGEIAFSKSRNGPPCRSLSSKQMGAAGELHEKSAVGTASS